MAVGGFFFEFERVSRPSRFRAASAAGLLGLRLSPCDAAAAPHRDLPAAAAGRTDGRGGPSGPGRRGEQCRKLQAPFNSGSLAVGARCCSLDTVEGISRRSCPSLETHWSMSTQVERGFAEETGTRRRRRSRVASQTPLKPPTQEELAVQKRQEAHARRVRQSLKKYLRRKREALKPKVEAAKKCAGCSLEVFDEDKNLWRHMRVNRVDVQWLEGGTIRRPFAFLRRRRDSSPSEKALGGLRSFNEPVRTEPRRAAQASRAASATRSSPSTTWKGCLDHLIGWI